MRDEGRVLWTIFWSLAAGVLLLALVLHLLGPTEAGADPDHFRWVWLGVALLAVFGAGVLRSRVDPRRAPEGKVRGTAVAVWALAEGQALLALVGTFLTADAVIAVLGLLVFAYLLARHHPGTFLPPGRGGHRGP